MASTLAPTYPTLADTLWHIPANQRARVWARQVILAVGGSLLVGLCAQFTIPFFPVPITGQTFALFLIALTYGSKLGGATIFLYLVEGAIGLPVFAGGAGGFRIFTGPTAGYLFGFFLVAIVCGRLAEKGFDRSYLKIALVMLIGNIVLFTPGLLWLGFFMGWDKPILAWGLYPFIPGDIIKMTLVVSLLPTTWKVIDRIKS